MSDQNPIRKWMRDARKEFASADEMKEFVSSILVENTRKLLEREAQEWAIEELRFRPERSGVKESSRQRAPEKPDARAPRATVQGGQSPARVGVNPTAATTNGKPKR